MKMFGQEVSDEISEEINGATKDLMSILTRNESIDVKLATIAMIQSASMLMLDKKINRIEKKITALLKIHDLSYKEEE